jgi:hypothetical protein
MPPGDDATPRRRRRGVVLDAGIVSILGQTSETNLAGSVNKLAGFTARNTCSDDTTGGGAIGDARDWIKAQFAAIAGLTAARRTDPSPRLRRGRWRSGRRRCPRSSFV